jgi:hypothetical protein
MTRNRVKRSPSKIDENEIVKKLQPLLKYRKVRVKDSEIKKVWKDFVNEFVCKELAEGNSVWLDGKMKLEVVGERLKEGTPEYELMKKGLYYSYGKIRKLNKVSPKRIGIKYKIEFETSRTKHKLYFEASPKLRKAVNKALSETSVSYRIR